MSCAITGLPMSRPGARRARRDCSGLPPIIPRPPIMPMLAASAKGKEEKIIKCSLMLLVSMASPSLLLLYLLNN